MPAGADEVLERRPELIEQLLRDLRRLQCDEGMVFLYRVTCMVWAGSVADLDDVIRQPLAGPDIRVAAEWTGRWKVDSIP